MAFERPTQELSYVKPETSIFNIIVVLTAALAGFNFSYANNAIAGCLAQPSFLTKFLSGPDASSLTSGMIGGWLGGGFIGTVVQAPISARWGRRPCTAAGSVILLISSALTAGSVNADMFIASRTLSGIGAGIVFANAPVYMAEVSPPHTRGLLVGCFAWSVNIGLLTAALASVGLNFVKQSYQWRLQFVFMCFFELVMLISVFLIPESPRWLIEQDRNDEAWIVLQRLHKSPHDPDGKLAKAEMLQIRAQIDSERSLPRSWSYLIRTPHMRRRVLCAFTVWVLGQGSGVVAFTQVLPLIFSMLGLDTLEQLGATAGYLAIATTGAFINIFIIDRVGRVRLMVFGGYLCSAVILTEALLQKYYLGTIGTAGLKAALAMMFLFIAFYSVTLDGALYVYLTEIWPTHMRSKGATIGFSSFFLNAIAYTAPAPLAFQNIGWKYYLVFFAVTVVISTVIMFLLPETKGLTLEEISAKFGDHVKLEYTNIYENAAAMAADDKEVIVKHIEQQNSSN